MWQHKKWVRGIAIGLGLAFLLLVWWILSSGSRHDQQISSDFGLLQHSVTAYAEQYQKLPPAIEAVPMNDAIRSRLARNNYSYTVLAENEYQLCTTFITKANGSTALQQHPAGKSCFINFVPLSGPSTPANLRVN